MVLMTQYAQVI